MNRSTLRCAAIQTISESDNFGLTMLLMILVSRGDDDLDPLSDCHLVPGAGNAFRQSGRGHDYIAGAALDGGGAGS
jgi:hypothetical protein